jgi:hypothetical protein
MKLVTEATKVARNLFLARGSCNLNWVGGGFGNQLLLIRSQGSCVAYTVPLGAAGSHKTINSIIICAVKTEIYSRSSVKQWSIFKENPCG